MYLFKENDIVYNWISCLIPDRIYFGPFPNQLLIDRLLDEKFDLIVNLTCEDEIIYNDITNITNKDNIVYNITKKNYLNFPIKDNEISKGWNPEKGPFPYYQIPDGDYWKLTPWNIISFTVVIAVSGSYLYDFAHLGYLDVDPILSHSDMSFTLTTAPSIS